MTQPNVCAQCLTDVREEDGFEVPNGEVLCGPCYFRLWGPRGAHAIHPEVEEQRPASRRPRKIRPFWSPGPLGELDPPPTKRRGRHS